MEVPFLRRDQSPIGMREVDAKLNLGYLTDRSHIFFSAPISYELTFPFTHVTSLNKYMLLYIPINNNPGVS